LREKLAEPPGLFDGELRRDFGLLDARARLFERDHGGEARVREGTLFGGHLAGYGINLRAYRAQARALFFELQSLLVGVQLGERVAGLDLAAQLESCGDDAARDRGLDRVACPSDSIRALSVIS